MGAIVTKVREKNNLAIVLFTMFLLWQGLILDYDKILTEDFNTYLYTKAIVNVIPKTSVSKQGETDILHQLIYRLTSIDTYKHTSLIEKSIPPLKSRVVMREDKDYQQKNMFTGPDSADSDEYFSPKDELKIEDFQIVAGDRVIINRDLLKDDSYVKTKLINFDANLNHNNQAMKKINIPDYADKVFKIDNKVQGPKVIIFHTHPKERFAGEEPGGGGVVDLGRHLKDILENKYGVETLHCTSTFEKTAETSKKDDYARMQIEVKKILEENPSIEIAIDIHRDGVGGSRKFLTNIKGENTAQLMFVNGFCHVQKNGVLTPIESLPNPYVEDNMALSLQLQLKAMEKYPGFTRKTLVKPYRYSLHMKPKSLLIEVGNENNTKEEALNTIDIFAELLMDVIKKD